MSSSDLALVSKLARDTQMGKMQWVTEESHSAITAKGIYLDAPDGVVTVLHQFWVNTGDRIISLRRTLNDKQISFFQHLYGTEEIDPRTQQKIKAMIALYDAIKTSNEQPA